MQTLEQLESQTLKIEIAAAVAQDAFTAKRASMELTYAEQYGWKAPLNSHQRRAMNSSVDAYMDRSKEGRDLTNAFRELREHNRKVARMRAGYAA